MWLNRELIVDLSTCQIVLTRFAEQLYRASGYAAVDRAGLQN